MTNDQNNRLLRVGDLARATGKTVRAIHLYEEMGLLRPSTRSSGGFRLYEPSAVERVRWIDLLHALGFSLQEMQDLLKAWWASDLGPKAMEQLRDLFRSKLEETREAIRAREQLERELIAGLEYLETCRGCPTAAGVAQSCTCCTQDHGMKDEPALVAGLMSRPAPARRSGRSAFVRVEDIG